MSGRARACLCLHRYSERWDSHSLTRSPFPSLSLSPSAFHRSEALPAPLSPFPPDTTTATTFKAASAGRLKIPEAFVDVSSGCAWILESVRLVESPCRPSKDSRNKLPCRLLLANCTSSEKGQSKLAICPIGRLFCQRPRSEERTESRGTARNLFSSGWNGSRISPFGDGSRW